MRALPERGPVQREAAKLGATLADRSLRDAAREVGAFGLFDPEELSGPELAQAWEGLGETADAGLCFALGAHALAVVAPIAAHATDELRARLLEPLRRGARLGAHAASEAEAGSDTMAMAATATPEAGGYRLSGSKLWVTNGADADVFVVFARAPEGVTGFVVERGAEGLTVGAPMEKMGLARASLTSLYLEGCRAEASAILGEPGGGAKVFHTAMLHERALILGPAVGVMRAQLERALKHARTRRQFGRPIGKNQLVAARVVEMYERYVLARMLLERAATALADGAIGAPLACLTKLRLSEWALEQHLDAIRLHGGTGYLEETGLPAHLRDAVGGVLYSGTSDMQRVILAAHLGL